MSLIDRLEAQLRQRGLAIAGPKPDDPDDKLYLTGPTDQKTPDILEAVKKFKPQLVEKYGRRKPEPVEGE